MAVQLISNLFPVSPLNTKGDLYVFGPGNTRLPVGPDGYILGCVSAQPTGLGYYDPLDLFLPPGADGQVLYNGNPGWGADAGLTYNDATDVLTVAGAIQTTEVGIDTVDTSSIFFSAGAGDPLMDLSVDAEALVRLESDTGQLSVVVNPGATADVDFSILSPAGTAFKYDAGIDTHTFNSNGGSFEIKDRLNTNIGLFRMERASSLIEIFGDGYNSRLQVGTDGGGSNDYGYIRQYSDTGFPWDFRISTIPAGGIAGNIELNPGAGGHVIINNLAGDNDFIIKKQTSGEAFKYDAGDDEISGDFITMNSSNTFLGKSAGNSTTSSVGNVAIGSGAGANITFNGKNTLIGTNAGADITGSHNNTCVGWWAGKQLTDIAGTFGGANNFFGVAAGYGITDGEINTVIGGNAQTQNNVSNCVILGNYAGYYNTLSNKFIVNSGYGTIPTYPTDLINGTFDPLPANQYLTFNANVTVTENLTIFSQLLTSLETGTLSADNAKLVTKAYVDDSSYKFNLGYFATGAALNAAYVYPTNPEASAGYWALVNDTDTMWVFDPDTNVFVDAGGVASSTLAGLSDTTITAPAVGNILVYGTSWVNQVNLPIGAMPVSGTWNLTAALTIDGGAVTVDDGLSVNTGLTLFGGTQVTSLSVGAGDNDKMVTQGYVDDAVSSAGLPQGPIRTVGGSLIAVLTTDFTILANGSLGATNIQLPAASTHAGRIFNIKCISLNNVVVVSTIDTALIDNAASYAFTTVMNSITVHCDGVNWWII